MSPFENVIVPSLFSRACSSYVLYKQAGLSATRMSDAYHLLARVNAMDASFVAYCRTDPFRQLASATSEIDDVFAGLGVEQIEDRRGVLVRVHKACMLFVVGGIVVCEGGVV